MATYLCTVDLVANQLKDVNYAIEVARAMTNLPVLSDLLRLRFEMITHDWDIPISIDKEGKVI